MEIQLRTLLYNSINGRKVAYNPLEPEPFDLVDLTIDVTNSTRIYHTRAECLREALEGASLIIADSQPLADTVRRAIPRARITALPFGTVFVTPNRKGPPVVGLLNHNDEVEMNNAHALQLLKGLKRDLLIYGRALPGVEAEIAEDFGAFCARCDILLLPSLPGAINSITLPLAAMSAGIAVLAHNAPGYYNLDAATGVQLLPHRLEAWRFTLDVLTAQPAKLQAMQERNQAYARRLNRENVLRAGTIAAQFPTPPPPVSDDCGCYQKSKASTQPGPATGVAGPQINPTEKEL